MNLIITDHCNRSCAYCFARDKVEIGADPAGITQAKHITLDTVSWYLDFLEKSNIKVFKILGGEPSIHPQFCEIVKLGLDRGFEVGIFTNGLWPDSIIEFFTKDQDERVSFVFNINHPDDQKEDENQRQKQCLKIAGKQARIGFNIYKDDFDIRFCKDLINEFGLIREIRLGLASPIVREENLYLKNSSLKDIGKRLASQLRELEKYDILGALDCGFPLCMFEQNDLGSLVVSTTKVGSYCNAIIDVDADLKTWPCFPLSKLLNVKLSDFNVADEVSEYYNNRLAPLKNIGSMDECITCKFLKRNQCCGGCLGRTIQNIEKSGDFRLMEKIEKGDYCVQA